MNKVTVTTKKSYPLKTFLVELLTVRAGVYVKQTKQVKTYVKG